VLGKSDEAARAMVLEVSVDKSHCVLCDFHVEQQMLPGSLVSRVNCRTCGTYMIPITLQVIWDAFEESKQKHLLSAKTREASDAGRPLTLTAENLSVLLESIPKLATPLDNMDRLVLLLSKRQQRADKGLALDTRFDYPLVFAHDGEEFKYLLLTLSQQGLVIVKFNDYQASVHLTPKGWERALELQRIRRESNQAFVAMWFAKELDGAWEEGFRPALKSTGFDPYRVDREHFNDKIDDHIVAEIRRSGLVVADFTGHRGGVYFEAGFAMGLGIPVIYTCRETDIKEAHFDTRQYNHIVWSTAADLKSKLALRIAATLPGRMVQP